MYRTPCQSVWLTGSSGLGHSTAVHTCDLAMVFRRGRGDRLSRVVVNPSPFRKVRDQVIHHYLWLRLGTTVSSTVGFCDVAFLGCLAFSTTTARGRQNILADKPMLAPPCSADLATEEVHRFQGHQGIPVTGPKSMNSSSVISRSRHSVPIFLVGRPGTPLACRTLEPIVHHFIGGRRDHLFGPLFIIKDIPKEVILDLDGPEKNQQIIQLENYF